MSRGTAVEGPEAVVDDRVHRRRDAPRRARPGDDRERRPVRQRPASITTAATIRDAGAQRGRARPRPARRWPPSVETRTSPRSRGHVVSTLLSSTRRAVPARSAAGRAVAMGDHGHDLARAPGPVGDHVGHRDGLRLPRQVGREHDPARARVERLRRFVRHPVGRRQLAGAAGVAAGARLSRSAVATRPVRLAAATPLNWSGGGGGSGARRLVQRQERDQRHEQRHPEQQGVERPRHEGSVRPAPDGPSACGSSHRSGGYSTRERRSTASAQRAR